MDSQLLAQFWLLPLTFYTLYYLFGLTMELVLIFKSTGPGPFAHPCWSPWTWSTWYVVLLFRGACYTESGLHCQVTSMA